jgi:putative PIN family toxin of toxin-antitoxin system
MRTFERIVIDTNVFFSAVVLPQSVPRQAVDKALDSGLLLFSEATMNELAQVLSREKFDAYAGREERTLFLGTLAEAAEFVPIIQVVRECRDPSDDKILEVALNGRADLIITGDKDLIAVNPWREIAILSPGEIPPALVERAHTIFLNRYYFRSDALNLCRAPWRM